MDNYVFSLAKSEDIPEILKFYHSLIGTPGCTWDFDYPNEEIVEHDVISESLYLLKENNIIISVAPYNYGYYLCIRDGLHRPFAMLFFYPPPKTVLNHHFHISTFMATSHGNMIFTF